MAGEERSLRDRALHAYAELVVEQGERSATLVSVAERAGSSKGGVLYHFASKQALADALTAHFSALAAADAIQMAAADEGAVLYFLRSSADEDPEFKLVYKAVTRLAMAQHPGAREALLDAQALWIAALEREVSDPMAVRAILLVSEGLVTSADIGLGITEAPVGGIPGAGGDASLLALHRWLVRNADTSERNAR